MGPGGGCLGSRAALTSLGAQFGPERFKTRACGRRCCSTPSRPPAAAPLPVPTAAAAGTVRPRGARPPRPAGGQERAGCAAEASGTASRAPRAAAAAQTLPCDRVPPATLCPGTMDTSWVRALLAWPLLLRLAAGGGPPRPGAALPRGCPAHCQCEPDGRMLLRVDCSDLGLSELPSNLSVFTSYL